MSEYVSCLEIVSPRLRLLILCTVEISQMSIIAKIINFLHNQLNIPNMLNKINILCVILTESK